MEADELESFSNLGFEIVSVGHFLHKNTKTVNVGGGWQWTMHDWKCPEYNRYEHGYAEFCKYNPNYPGLLPNVALNLPNEFLALFDLIVVSNTIAILQLVKYSCTKDIPIVYCTVGQVSQANERSLKRLRQNDSRVKIIRVSTEEQACKDFSGVDCYITGSVKHDFISNVWKPTDVDVITVCRSILGRKAHTCHDLCCSILQNFQATVYGKGNENFNHPIIKNGGELSYPKLIECYSSKSVFLACPSHPAPLTYTVVEAFSSGIPTVVLSKSMAKSHYPSSFYDFDSIIENGVTGFIANSTEEAILYIKTLLSDINLSNKISIEAKKEAKKRFSKEVVEEKWVNFFKTIGLI